MWVLKNTLRNLYINLIAYSSWFNLLSSSLQQEITFRGESCAQALSMVSYGLGTFIKGQCDVTHSFEDFRSQGQES